MTEIRLAVPAEIDRYLDALVRTGPFGTKAELVRAAIVAYAQTAGPMAHDFDKVNHFSPDGRLYQVEYARESSKRGLRMAGAVYDRGVVLGANVSRGGNPTLKALGKIVRTSPQVMLATSGLVADGRTVRRHVLRQTWKSAEELVDDLSRLFFEHTLRSDTRPLGCAVLLATTFGKEPRLFEVDPSGSVSEVGADVVGNLEDEARGALLKGYRPGKLKEAEGLVQRALIKDEEREIVRLEV